jgi:hypothetical protein
MTAQCRYVKIGLSMVAWSGVLVASTYRSYTPVVFGQYSWGQVILLGLLMCTAVLAEPLTDNIMNYWTKMVTPPEQALSRVMSKLTEINTFVRRCSQTISEATSYLVVIFMSCKRATHRLMSSVPHL